MIRNVDKVPDAVSKVERQMRREQREADSWPNLDVDALTSLLKLYATWSTTLAECVNIIAVNSESFHRISALFPEIVAQQRRISSLILEKKRDANHSAEK